MVRDSLADAQPGGRVRLGDALLPCPFCGARAERIDFGIGSGENEGGSCIACTVCQHSGPIEFGYKENFVSNWNRRALSAQPSQGGQGDALDCIGRIEEAIELRVPHDIYAAVHGELAELKAALAARQPVTMDDALAVGDGTLHGAIDHWQERALRAEADLAARQPAGEPVCSGGFVITNGSGEKYMAWGQVGPEWTADRSAALWLVRRADAEALAAENEDAWSILPVDRCALPPNGWACTLAAGHEGPCPTIAGPTAQAVDPWSVIDRVAKNWDGCSIGPAIRAEAEKVIGQPAQQPAQVYLDGLDRALGEAIDQRDRYHEVADDLAGHIAAITGVDIGEHSSANCPWQNAIDAAEEYTPAQAVDLGQFRASVLHAYEEIHDGYHSEKLGSLLALIDSVAVGNGTDR